MDRPVLRARMVDANDGIVATAGIVEGFAGAGAGYPTLLAAALAAMVAGSLAAGGAKYSEAAAERDAQVALIEEERRQLELSPAEELAELTAHYEHKGLEPDLADQVARQLTDRDALAAHVEAEHGLSGEEAVTRPVNEAAGSGIAFAGGAGIPTLAIVLTPPHLRIPVVFAVVVLALCLTSVVVARSGGGSVIRIIRRAVTIGVVTMAITLAGGQLFDL